MLPAGAIPRSRRKEKKVEAFSGEGFSCTRYKKGALRLKANSATLSLADTMNCSIMRCETDRSWSGITIFPLSSTYMCASFTSKFIEPAPFLLFSSFKHSLSISFSMGATSAYFLLSAGSPSSMPVTAVYVMRRSLFIMLWQMS